MRTFTFFVFPGPRDPVRVPINIRLTDLRRELQRCHNGHGNARLFLVGDFSAWQTRERFRLPLTPRATHDLCACIGPLPIKYVAECHEEDADRIAECLCRMGYLPTGNGEHDPDAHLRRIWFLTPQLPVGGNGVYAYNLIPSLRSP